MPTATMPEPAPNTNPTETPAEFAQWMQEVQSNLYSNPPARLSPHEINAAAQAEREARLHEAVVKARWAPWTRGLQHEVINRLLVEATTAPVQAWETGRPQASHEWEDVQ